MGEDQLVILLTKRTHICFLHTEALQPQNCCNLGADVRGKTGDPEKCTFKLSGPSTETTQLPPSLPPPQLQATIWAEESKAKGLTGGLAG